MFTDINVAIEEAEYLKETEGGDWCLLQTRNMIEVTQYFPGYRCIYLTNCTGGVVNTKECEAAA